MAKDDYFRLLLDPKWQKRKTEIQIRDKFTCQFCSDTGTTLNVHHKYYDFNKPPWDYPNEALILLCEPCHISEEKAKIDFKEGVKELLESGFLYLDLLYEIKLFKHTRRKK